MLWYFMYIHAYGNSKHDKDPSHSHSSHYSRSFDTAGGNVSAYRSSSGCIGSDSDTDTSFRG